MLCLHGKIHSTIKRKEEAFTPRKSKDIVEFFKESEKQDFMDMWNQFGTLRKEFMEDLRNSPLVLLDGVNAGIRTCYAFILTQRFAICIMLYNDTANDGKWPEPPDYAAPDGPDTVEIRFWQYVNQPPPRELEEVDFDYKFIWTGAGTSVMKDYVKTVYYDRKKKIWNGYDLEDNVPGDDMSGYVATGANWFLTPDFGGFTPDDLFKFWFLTKIRYSNFQIPIFNPPPPQPELIEEIEPKVFAFQKEKSQVIGYEDFKVLLSGGKHINLQNNWVYMFKNLNLLMEANTVFVVRLDLTKSYRNEIMSTDLEIQSTLENWLFMNELYNPEERQQTQAQAAEQAAAVEWFTGQFPKTEYNHMVFYGGHSFYIPDGYNIDSNITRLSKDAGYLTVKFITDVLSIKLFFIPMRNTVSYGKYTEYHEPDQAKLVEIMKKQWWSVITKLRAWTKKSGLYIVTSKEAAVAMGKRGTQLSGVIPGVNAITSLITTGAGLA